MQRTQLRWVLTVLLAVTAVCPAQSRAQAPRAGRIRLRHDSALTVPADIALDPAEILIAEAWTGRPGGRVGGGDGDDRRMSS